MADLTDDQLEKRRATNQRTLKIAAAVGGVLLLLALIGYCSGDPEPADDQAPGDAASSEPVETEPAEEAEEEEPVEEPVDEEPAFDAAALEKELVANLGHPIKDGCDTSAITWHCLYEGLDTTVNDDRIEVHLSSLAGEDMDEISEQARLHIFNFLGLDHEDLGAITSFVDDVDSGTTYRGDVPLLNR